MRKRLLLLSLLATHLYGEQSPASENNPAQEETIPEIESEPSAAINSTRVARNSNEWRNWVFAAGAAVVFTAGVLIVTLNTGSSQSGH